MAKVLNAALDGNKPLYFLKAYVEEIYITQDNAMPRWPELQTAILSNWPETSRHDALVEVASFMSYYVDTLHREITQLWEDR